MRRVVLARRMRSKFERSENLLDSGEARITDRKSSGSRIVEARIVVAKLTDLLQSAYGAVATPIDVCI